IVNEGLKYLEGLTAEASDDPALQLELGRAYLRIGAVQGRPNAANLGDRDGAVRSFRKAKALLAPLAKDGNAPPAVFGSYLDAVRYLSETLGAVVNERARADALAEAFESTRAANAFAERHPALDESRGFVGSAEFALAARLGFPESLAHWKKAGAAYD